MVITGVQIYFVRKTLQENEKLSRSAVTQATAKNVGRIPAFLTELIVDLDTFPRDAFPEYPPYPASKPFAKFIIPPNGEHGGIVRKVLRSPAEQKELWDGKLDLVFFGMIRYKAGTNEYTTQFCSYWHWDGPTLNRTRAFEPVGPPNWVDYT